MRNSRGWFGSYKNKIVLACAAAIVLYGLTSTGQYNIRYEYIIDYDDPKAVWEFVADFSNMKKLNPTLRTFTIISETGNYNDWNYEVEYTENLHNLPFVLNKARAKYQVVPVNQVEFLIRSLHVTCFYGSACLQSRSEFRFIKVGGGEVKTLCVEEIAYQCPRFLSKFCSSEVMFQRESIRYNLNHIFTESEAT